MDDIREELRGKRLLLLGGSLWKNALRRFAEKYEVVLLATGNNRSAGIFELASEGFDVDSTDAEAMKKLIREQKIDGVYMGGAEPVIASACGYLNELGMPAYCNPRQWDLLQNKIQFKELCRKFDLPVAPRFELDFNADDLGVPAKEFPVIVKPADGCGGSGFRICKTLDELKSGYQNAAKLSPSGSVIVEKYVKNTSVVVYYTFSEGRAHFSAIEDKRPVHFEGKGFIAGTHIFQSPRADEFRALFEEKLVKMFAELELKEGSLWMEVFCGDGNYYFNEAGLRYSGSASMYPVDYFTGVNQVAADCYFALTGKSKLTGFLSLVPEKTVRKKNYCIYLMPLNPGTITKTVGFDELNEDPNFVAIAYAKGVGAVVPPDGNLSQNFAYLHFVFNDENDFNQIVEKIWRETAVLDENGVNMTRRMFDSSAIDFASYR